MADDSKLAEFREKNIALLKEVDALKESLKEFEAFKTKYEGIGDPEAIKAERLKLAELEKTTATLETQLAAEKAARTEAQEKATKSRVRDALRVKALPAGVLPAALDIFLDKAEGIFTMEGDVVKAKPNTFSPTRPGELLTPDEWIANATRDLSFLFAPSKGSGAIGNHGTTGGSRSGELRNPTPQQLGENAAAIARGDLKVVYD